jgi:6-phosphogluconolactonase
MTHKEHFFIGTYASGPKDGIFRLTISPEHGGILDYKLLAEASAASYLILNARENRLYAVCESGSEDGAVRSYQITTDKAGTPELQLINEVASGGKGPCHLALSSDERFLVTANYGSGGAAVLPLRGDGGLDAPVQTIPHSGSGPNKQRQQGPHAHSVTFSPDGAYFFVCDLGTDSIEGYRLHGGNTETPAEHASRYKAAPGSGPRHFTFGKNGHYAYALNELSSDLIVFRYESEAGELTEIQTISALSPTYSGGNTAAAVRINPEGTLLYASNRGEDSIAVFSIDPQKRTLRDSGRFPSGGRTPRDFNFSRAWTYMVTANQDSDTVCLLAKEDGSPLYLRQLGTAEIHRPVCVCPF